MRRRVARPGPNPGVWRPGKAPLAEKKKEHLPLVVALIAGAVSIAGVAYTQHATLHLERQKWERGQEDARRKALTEAIGNYGRELSIAVQRTQLLAWTAEHEPEAINAAALAEYDKAAIASLSALAVQRLLLAAQDQGIANRVNAAAGAYYRADECIAMAGAAVRKDGPNAALQLSACKAEAAAAATSLLCQFSSVLDEKSIANAKDERTPCRCEALTLKDETHSKPCEASGPGTG